MAKGSGRGATRAAVRAAAMTLVLAGALSAASCTGPGAIVTETPAPTLTASAQPSPSPTPLTDAELLALMPPDAAYPDLRGAIATAEFFVELFAVAFNAHDTQVWLALSGDSCGFCAGVASDIRDSAEANRIELGGAITPDRNSVRANLNTADGFTYVDFAYVQEPSETRTASGELVESYEGSSGRTYLRMELIGQVWRVAGVEVVPDGE